MNTQQLIMTLQTLGITQCYRGFSYIVYAVHLVIEDDRRLLSMERSIYRATGEHFQQDYRSVERNIRTVIQRAWLINRAYLESLARYRLDYTPTVSEFIAILANHLRYAEHQE